MLDWLREEYDLAKPSDKPFTPIELDSDTWVSEVKRLRGKKRPLSSAGLYTLRGECGRTIALAAEALTLERALSDLANQAYALTPAGIDLRWRSAPPCMAIPAPRP